MEKISKEEVVAALIQEGQKIISKPESWHKGSLAGIRDHGGAVHPSTVSEKQSNSFCSVGAIIRAKNKLREENRSNREVLELLCDEQVNAARAILDRWAGGNVVHFNDHAITRHEDVIKVFKSASVEACQRLKLKDKESGKG